MGVGGDGSQRLIQLMGDTRRHLTHGAETCHPGEFVLVLTRLILCLFTFGDITEHHHRTEGPLRLILHRGATVLHRNTVPSLVPEGIVRDEAGLVVTKGLVDRAILRRMRGAIRTGVVQNLMLV